MTTETESQVQAVDTATSALAGVDPASQYGAFLHHVNQVAQETLEEEQRSFVQNVHAVTREVIEDAELSSDEADIVIPVVHDVVRGVLDLLDDKGTDRGYHVIPKRGELYVDIANSNKGTLSALFDEINS
jgi:hypothetical protein